jgi:hypothetical protein
MAAIPELDNITDMLDEIKHMQAILERSSKDLKLGEKSTSVFDDQRPAYMDLLETTSKQIRRTLNLTNAMLNNMHDQTKTSLNDRSGVHDLRNARDDAHSAPHAGNTSKPFHTFQHCNDNCKGKERVKAQTAYNQVILHPHRQLSKTLLDLISECDAKALDMIGHCCNAYLEVREMISKPVPESLFELECDYSFLSGCTGDLRKLLAGEEL